MGPVIGDVLPLAIGVAISPLPIIAVILMLFSARARQNGPAFLGGWLAGLGGVVLVVGLVAGASGASSGGPRTLASLIVLALGLLLIVLAFVEWRRRPAPGAEVEMPKWMATVDSLEPSKAFGLGVLLSAVNPKNLTLAVGAALAIAQAGLSAVQGFVVLLVFLIVASITVGGAVLYYLVGGESAKQRLDGWKTWLGQNNALVMALLLLIIGVVLLGKGLGGLIG
jgi:threonine/homoserine/homoserine lactone efflux protein